MQDQKTKPEEAQECGCESDTPENWMDCFLNDRMQMEVRFNHLYAKQFHHGTDGHNARIVMARLTEALDLLTATGSPIRAAVLAILKDEQDCNCCCEADPVGIGSDEVSVSTDDCRPTVGAEWSGRSATYVTAGRT